MPELDLAAHPCCCSVLGSHRQSSGRDVRRHDPLKRTLRRESQRHGTAPGPHVQGRHPRMRDLPRPGEDRLDQLLRLGSGDEDPLVHAQVQFTKCSPAQNVLQWLSARASQKSELESTEFLRAERPVEVEIQIESPHSQHIRQEVLGIEPSAIDPLLPQVLGTPLHHLQDRPGAAIGGGHHPRAARTHPVAHPSSCSRSSSSAIPRAARSSSRSPPRISSRR